MGRFLPLRLTVAAIGAGAQGYPLLPATHCEREGDPRKAPGVARTKTLRERAQAPQRFGAHAPPLLPRWAEVDRTPPDTAPPSSAR